MNEEEIALILKKGIKWVVLAIVALIFIFSAWGSIDAGERGIKTRGGAVVGTLEQGYYMKLPFIEEVHEMDVRTRSISYEKGEGFNNQLSGASKDLQDVSIGVVTTFHIDPSKVGIIFSSYSSVDNYQTVVIEPIVKNVVKTVTAQYSAEEIASTKRAEINEKVNAKLAEELATKDAILESANTTNFDLSKAFTDAIEAKVTAVQLAEAQKNKLEEVKYKAQQTIETAKAEAESIRIKAQSINSQGGADYVKLKAIEQWDGKGCTSYCGLETANGLLIQR